MEKFAALSLFMFTSWSASVCKLDLVMSVSVVGPNAHYPYARTWEISYYARLSYAQISGCGRSPSDVFRHFEECSMLDWLMAGAILTVFASMRITMRMQDL